MTQQTILPPCTCTPAGDMNGAGHNLECPTTRDALLRRAPIFAVNRARKGEPPSSIFHVRHS
jgi:hypothetical protein